MKKVEGEKKGVKRSGKTYIKKFPILILLNNIEKTFKGWKTIFNNISEGEFPKWEKFAKAQWKLRLLEPPAKYGIIILKTIKKYKPEIADVIIPVLFSFITKAMYIPKKNVVKATSSRVRIDKIKAM